MTDLSFHSCFLLDLGLSIFYKRILYILFKVKIQALYCFKAIVMVPVLYIFQLDTIGLGEH